MVLKLLQEYYASESNQATDLKRHATLLKLLAELQTDLGITDRLTLQTLQIDLNQSMSAAHRQRRPGASPTG